MRIKHDFVEDFHKKTPQVAYCLGFIQGDGWISAPDKKYYQIMVTVKDSDSIYLDKSIYRIAPWTRTYRLEDSNIRQNQVRYTISNKNLINFLNYDLDMQNKNKYISPKLISFIPDSLHKYFWRGLFDADGGLYRIKNRPTYLFSDMSSNFDFDWTEFENLLTRLNIKFRVLREVCNKKLHHRRSIVKMETFSTMQYLSYIYKGFAKDDVGYTRKWLKYVKYMEDRYVITNQKQWMTSNTNVLNHVY